MHLIYDMYEEPSRLSVANYRRAPHIVGVWYMQNKSLCSVQYCIFSVGMHGYVVGVK